MSRWLKSVNNLLETLDGQVENVVDESGDSFSNQFDDNDYDSDDYNSEYDSEELESELETSSVVDFDEAPQASLFPDVEPFEEESVEEEEEPQVLLPKTTQPPTTEPQIPVEAGIASDPVSTAVHASEQPASQDDHVTKATDEDAEAPINTNAPYAKAPSAVERVVQPRPPRPPPPPLPPPAPKPTGFQENVAKMPPPTLEVTQKPPQSYKSISSAPMSGMSSIETPPASGVVSLPTNNTSPNNNKHAEQLKRSNRELKKVQTEMRQLRKHVLQLNAQLEGSETEMAAQRQELQRAAERMERDRLRHKEETEDLMEEHEDEMEQQKEHYEKLLREQKTHLEQVAQGLSDRLSMEEAKRVQEGGDWTQELEDSLAREREALKKLGEIKYQNAALQSSLTKLEAQQNALQIKLDSSAQYAQTASAREREAEDKLDAALFLHSRQLGQRQAREAELERTIADLGAALTVARQKEHNRVTRGSKTGESNETGYKKQCELALEELETVRVQFRLETQRCEALRKELEEVSQERTDEASAARARQQQHDRTVADLTATVAQLEATVRELKKSTGAPVTGESTSSEDPRVLRLLKESEEMRRKVASVSEQLIRSQERNERSKSEVLALTNRLQAANDRAQSAEQALAAAPPPSTVQMYQVEGGGVSYGSGVRRRVKGGRERKSVRSIRSVLNLNPGRVGEGTEQVAATIDAIDSWVVETGGFLRHEPLARLAFVLYLILLHLWAFCLVLFHTHSFEKEHADFGSLKMMNAGLPEKVGKFGHGHP